MEVTVDLVLFIFAFVCFALAALNVKTPVNLVALGLACWVLTAIV